MERHVDTAKGDDGLGEEHMHRPTEVARDKRVYIGQNALDRKRGRRFRVLTEQTLEYSLLVRLAGEDDGPKDRSSEDECCPRCPAPVFASYYKAA